MINCVGSAARAHQGIICNGRQSPCLPPAIISRSCNASTDIISPRNTGADHRRHRHLFGPGHGVAVQGTGAAGGQTMTDLAATWPMRGRSGNAETPKAFGCHKHHLRTPRLCRTCSFKPRLSRPCDHKSVGGGQTLAGMSVSAPDSPQDPREGGKELLTPAKHANAHLVWARGFPAVPLFVQRTKADGRTEPLLEPLESLRACIAVLAQSSPENVIIGC